MVSLTAALALAVSAVASAQALTFERVAIPADASAATPALTAFMAKPASGGPVAAIVALHGCSGLIGPQGNVLPIYRDWAERLVAAGYSIIFPDSFGSRGIGAQCTVKDRQILPRDRAGDAAAVARWLAAQPAIDGKRMALMGWSHGGVEHAVDGAVQPGDRAKRLSRGDCVLSGLFGD